MVDMALGVAVFIKLKVSDTVKRAGSNRFSCAAAGHGMARHSDRPASEHRARLAGLEPALAGDDQFGDPTAALR